MKRIMVVDDERPVVEGISLIVRRELAGEFEVAGTAVSGREAIEKIASLAPDIVLMDVRMPGLSGLDAIREMRARGATQAFILVTAYERFDIAREAVGLGVIDYLLKPVSKDSLALSLRAASELLDRRIEVERREIEHRDAEERMRGFVESSFLYAIALGVPTRRRPAEIPDSAGLAGEIRFRRYRRIPSRRGCDAPRGRCACIPCVVPRGPALQDQGIDGVGFRGIFARPRPGRRFRRSSLLGRAS